MVPSLRQCTIVMVFLAACLAPCLCVQAHGISNPELLAYSVEKSNQDKVAELPTVSASDLPPEAKRVLDLIRQGGPFPYPRDGIVFGNRERYLPVRPRGYYKEYTVKTPGRSDRGARRIVAGAGGEFYYTEDHYKTFRLIKE